MSKIKKETLKSAKAKYDFLKLRALGYAIASLQALNKRSALAESELAEMRDLARAHAELVLRDRTYLDSVAERVERETGVRPDFGDDSDTADFIEDGSAPTDYVALVDMTPEDEDRIRRGG